MARGAWLKAASARFYLIAALMTLASAVIVNAFLTDDFTIKYVAHYSDTRPAALLQDHVVLGRARRLDHVLGVPALGLRRDCGATSTASGIAS